jgi:hypothetical protein
VLNDATIDNILIEARMGGGGSFLFCGTTHCGTDWERKPEDDSTDDRHQHYDRRRTLLAGK